MTEKFDTIIVNGMVVLPHGVVSCDIGVKAGRIAALGEELTRGDATGVIEAKGRYVLPGVVDPHVHFRTFTHHVDNLEEAHRSAAYGGVTTVLSLIRGNGEMRPSETVAHFQEEGADNALVDYSFHIHLLEGDDQPLDDIERVVELGVTTFKMMMSYKAHGLQVSDRFLFGAMQRVQAVGGIVQLHAEDGDLIDHLIEQAEHLGKTRPADFLPTHPEEEEVLAVQKAIQFAKLSGCWTYILHLAAGRAVEDIERAQAEGVPILAETCPQYLLLTDRLLTEMGPEAKIGPPLRTDWDREGLWEGIRRGAISVVASDHSAKTRAMKMPGHKNIFDIWYGAPGVEAILPVTFSAMRRQGFAVDEIARVLSENPARLMGLYPRKGVIQVGADADLVLLDPEKKVTIRGEEMHTPGDFSLFEGMEVQGWPVMSLLRGRVLLDDGELRQKPGYGQFLARRPNPEELNAFLAQRRRSL